MKSLIRGEMAKDIFLPIMVVFGVSGGKLCKIYVKIRLFSFLTYVLRLKPSQKITDYVDVAKLPPPPLTRSKGVFILFTIIYCEEYNI